VGDADLVLIVTAHRGLVYERVATRARLVVDLRGVTRSHAAANVVRL
jgi:UDP-N-acetyl-D-mannosaminuronate dehydrogenase